MENSFTAIFLQFSICLRLWWRSIKAVFPVHFKMSWWGLCNSCHTCMATKASPWNTHLRFEKRGPILCVKKPMVFFNRNEINNLAPLFLCLSILFIFSIYMIYAKYWDDRYVTVTAIITEEICPISADGWFIKKHA